MTDIEIWERAFHLATQRYPGGMQIEAVLHDATAIEAFLRGEWRPAVAVVPASAGEDVGPAMNEAAARQEAQGFAGGGGGFFEERAASLPSDVEEFSTGAAELLREVDRAKAQRNVTEERRRYLASVDRLTGGDRT